MVPQTNPHTAFLTSQQLPHDNKKSFERDVNLFLLTTQKISNDILGSENRHRCESIGRVKERHFWMWWPMTPFYGDPYSYRRRDFYCHERESSEDTLRWLIGLAAVILGGYAIFKVAEGISRFKEASEEIEENWDFKNKLRLYESMNLNLPHFEEIKQVAELKSRIFRRIKTEEGSNLILMVSLVAASGLALLGAVMASGALMTIGTASAIAGGVALLARTSFQRMHRQHVRDAHLIRHYLRVISSN